jgi:hypothetical protein
MPRRTLILFSLILLLALAAPAAEKAPDAKSSEAQKTTKSGKLVDEGSFAIFQNNRRVATEEFTIREFADRNVTFSRLRLNSGDGDASTTQRPMGVLEQTSELTLFPDGSLSRYEWKQTSPTVRSAIVEPKQEVLIMHTTANGKTSDNTFFLTPATFVLDDYVFSIREVLLWRYLASSCQPRAGGEGCDLIRTRFPVLVPLRGTSGEVYIEFKGYDDTPLNGRPQHLRHFVIQSDGPDWNLWLDERQKLLRMSIPGAATEVLRQEK